MALMTIDKIKLSAIATAKAVSDKSQPVVIVQQAAQDDGVRRLIESATEEQLVVLADLLRQASHDNQRESDASRESAATT